MLKVGDKVKLNVEVLEKAGFDELNETDVLFIKENPERVFEIVYDWNEHLLGGFTSAYRFELSSQQLGGKSFCADELVLVEENAEW